MNRGGWLLLGLLLVVGCGPVRQAPLNLPPPEGPWQCLEALSDTRNRVRTLRALGEVTYRHDNGEIVETARCVVIAQEPDHFLVDLLDPLGRSGLTLQIRDGKAWYRTRDNQYLRDEFQALAQLLTPRDLAAVMLGLPVPFCSEGEGMRVLNVVDASPSEGEQPGYLFSRQVGERTASMVPRPDCVGVLRQDMSSTEGTALVTYEDWELRSEWPYPARLRIDLNHRGNHTLEIRYRRVQVNPELDERLFSLEGYSVLAPDDLDFNTGQD